MATFWALHQLKRAQKRKENFVVSIREMSPKLHNIELLVPTFSKFFQKKTYQFQTNFSRYSFSLLFSSGKVEEKKFDGSSSLQNKNWQIRIEFALEISTPNFWLQMCLSFFLSDYICEVECSMWWFISWYKQCRKRYDTKWFIPQKLWNDILNF